MVVVYETDTGIFDGESLVVRPPAPAPRVVVPLNHSKNMAAKLDLKILVGNRGNNTSFHVFEETYVLPKFAMFLQQKTALKPEPTGSVRFKTPLKTQQASRPVDWA